MKRLVIALTALLTAAGVAVIAAYLLLFGAATDRAAALVPADVTLYANVYLQPSTGQQMNLQDLISRFPGFTDRATVGDKLDELAQRLLGANKVDYRADLKPWLGDQLAVAAQGTAAKAGEAVVIAAVKDRKAAEAALARITGRSGQVYVHKAYDGVDLLVGPSATYGFVNEMLVVGQTADRVHVVVDVAHGRARSLLTQATFVEAMRGLPTDYLASVYVDLPAAAGGNPVVPAAAKVGGVAAVVVAQSQGVRLVGQSSVLAVPSASPGGSFSAAGIPTLSGFMPTGTQAEVTVFGLQQILAQVETQLGAEPSTKSVASQLSQLRALAALGLGIDIDRDLLPLLDGETALGVASATTNPPRGVLLLRPRDGAAARAALDRVRDALAGRGGQVSTTSVQGVQVTTLIIPGATTVAYAVKDGVAILGLSSDDVSASLAAQAGGKTLAASAAYRDAFSASGNRAGAEMYVDAAPFVAPAITALTLPSEARGILQHVGALGMTVRGAADRIEFEALITIH